MWRQVLLLLLATGSVVSQKYFNGLRNNYGSTNGATEVQMTGLGFADGSASIGGADKGNLIYFYDKYNRQYSCPAENDRCTHDTLTCHTNPMPAGTYYVRVFVDGEEIPDKNYCGGNRKSWACTFITSAEQTPTITVLTPAVTTPGVLLRIHGRILTDKLRAATETSSNGRGVSLRRIWISGYPCDLYNSTGDPYGVTVGSNDYGTIQCMMQGKFVSSQKVSFIVDGNFGRSHTSVNLIKIAGDYKLHSLQTYAIVNGTDPPTGSTEGGTLLTVTGDYLNDDSIHVTIAGQECTVVERTDPQVTCITPAAVSGYDVYPGSRGFMAEFYPGLTDASEIDSYTGEPEKKFFEDSHVSYTASSSPVLARVRGFFVPARHGIYSFTSTKGNTDIYLSTDQTQANKELHSGRANLTAGELYYLEAIYKESSARVDLAIHAYLEQSDYLSSETFQSIEEVQVIKTTSPDRNEIQTITLKNWTTIDSPRQEAFSICVNCTEPLLCEGDEEFVLSLYGYRTEGLAANEEAESIQRKINNLVVLGGDEVVVVEHNATLYDGCTSYYEMTVQTYRGSLAFKVTPSSNWITVKLRVISGAKPDKNSFTVSLDGIPTGHVPISDTGPALAKAVASLFGTACPEALEAGIGEAFLYQGFESGSQISVAGTRTGSDSYCGTHSMWNPSTIFQNSNSPFRTDEHPMFCIAHRGTASAVLMMDYIYTFFNFEDFTFKDVRADRITLHRFEPTNEWNHICLDIEMTLKSLIDLQGFDIRVTWMGMSGNGIYIDNVFIGSPLHWFDNEDRYLNVLREERRPPLHSSRVASVSASKSGDVFTVTIVPHGCDNGFPLIEIGHATEQEDGVYNDTKWQNSTIVVARSTAASPPVGGTFNLTLPGIKNVYGGTITSIPYGVGASVLENYIENLPGIRNVHVTRTGDCRGYTWTVTFQSPGGRQAEFVASENFAYDDARIGVTVTQKGGIYLRPISGDWLRAAYDKPQLEIKINNVPSSCTGDCSFQWSDERTPELTSAVLATGVVTIAGVDFSSTMEDNTVRVGGVTCDVTSSTTEAITCTLGHSPGGSQDVVVNVRGMGDSNAMAVSVPVAVTAISPTSGSTQGGTRVVLTGTALDGEISVTIGDSPCTVTESNYNTVSCQTGPSAAGNGNIEVTVGSLDADVSATYTLEDPTAIVSTVNVTLLSVIGDEVLGIAGAGFGDESAEHYVSINGDNVEIASWTASEITVLSPSLPPGEYDLKIYVHPLGFANVGQNLEYYLAVHTLSPVLSSLQGGVELTLTGAGFDEEPTVMLGHSTCDVDSYTDQSITCTLGSCGRRHIVENTGDSIHGTGYAWNPSHLDVLVGEEVVWRWLRSDSLTGATFQVFSVETVTDTTYDGNGFNSGAPTEEGAYAYVFNIPGTYHYGGCASADCSIFMRGTVEVSGAEDTTLTLSVTVGGHEATYEDDARNVISTPTFTCQDALTPTVTSISPRSGTSDTLITITGTGLSGSADPSVHFGEAECTVVDANDTSVSCKVHTDTEMPVGIYQLLSVNVPEKGLARIEIQDVIQRHFALSPLISSVAPTIGSLEGGAELTIQGGGLNAASVVLVGTKTCTILDDQRTYHSVTCITDKNTVGVQAVQVFVSSTLMEAACIGTCTYEHSVEHTPNMTALSVTSVSEPGQPLTISGTGYGTDPNAVQVLVGETECAVTGVSQTSINCTLGDLVAGVHAVDVIIAGTGRAAHIEEAADENESSSKSRVERSTASGEQNTHTVTSNAVIDSIDPSSGSVHGGTAVSVRGNGFSESDTIVALGTVDQPVERISVSHVVVDTAEYGTAGTVLLRVSSNGVEYPTLDYEYSWSKTPNVTAILPDQGQAGDSVTIYGTQLEGSPETHVDVGGADCLVTDTQPWSVTCTLGNRFGGEAYLRVLVDGLGYADVGDDVKFEYLLRVESIQPAAGSLGGGQLVTVTGKGFDTVSKVTICGEDCAITGDINATLITCVTPTSDDDGNCDVVVTNEDNSDTLQGAYEYDPSLTPAITSVSPSIGGTAGGTTLAIDGTGLLGATEVNIDGSPCIIKSNTATQIQCVTEAHKGSIEAKVTVTMGTNGDAPSDNADFHYIDRWSSNYTWGGLPLPAEGDFVVIPEGAEILLDTDTPVLKMLLIQGGKLVFKDEGAIHLRSENILIAGGGVLEIGTEEQPYTAQATITMHGHLRSPELPIYGAKTLGVRKGRLEMHGKHIAHTWTLLDETASAGATTLKLQESVSWKAGDSVVIATTGSRHSQSQNEERVIKSVTEEGGKTVLELTESLKYTHLGITETYDGGVTFDYRAEVGLLTRNIVFRGSDDTDWHDKIEKCSSGFDTGMFATQTCFQGRFGEEVGSDEFGGSIMIHAMNRDRNEAVAHIEYTELNYVGQAFRLGRYPIHWHLLGNMNGSYVRGCAIHRSFNRAVTIHNTHYLLVERNVIYNIMGGAVFIEDGIETNNVIQYNLAVFVKQSTSLLNDDITPAAYWVTNPDNILRHNHAAGGTHFGFWYRMHQNPDWPSYTPNVCQQNAELGEFRNNTVHSQGWYGIWIFISYHPKEGGSCGSNLPKAAKFYELKAYFNHKCAEWVDVGAIQFHGFVCARNAGPSLDLRSAGPYWHKGDRGAMVTDTTIIGAPGIDMPGLPGLWLDGLTFIDVPGPAISLGGCSFCGGFQYRVENMNFFNTPLRTNWGWEHQAIVLDLDGSFSGTGEPNTQILPGSDIIGGPGCEIGNNAMFGGKTAVCASSVKFHRVAFNNVVPGSFEGRSVTFANQYGNTTVPWMKKRLTHARGWMVLLQSREEYSWTFANSDRQTNHSYDAAFYDMDPDDWLIIRHQLALKPDGVVMNGRNSRDVDNVTTITKDSRNRAWDYDINTRIFRYLVSGGQARKKRSTGPEQIFSSMGVSPGVYRCFYPDCIVPIVESGTVNETREPPDDPTIITHPEQNSTCFEYEGETAENNDVLIPVGCWVVWEIKNVTVKMLRIEGTVEFSTKIDSITLSAWHIVVLGRVIAGWASDDPHTKPLHIILLGNKTSPEFPIFYTLTLGAKGLGCQGLCDFHGLKVGETWVKVGDTAPAGSNTLTLAKAVTWKAGDEIVISTTGFNPWQTEEHTIRSISPDGRVLTLEDPLKHDHKHEVKNYTSRWTSIDTSAEVGLLTRSIKIEGKSYEGMEDDAFGARVFVTSHGAYRAKGRFSHVQFTHTGQFGYRSPNDPRFSIAWLNTAPGSELIGCAFQKGFAPAVGVFGTHRIVIEGNVIYRTVGEGMIITGSAHVVANNLVTLAIFQGTYQGRTAKNPEIPGGIDIANTAFLRLMGNVVAGSERVGYVIAGQSCGNNLVGEWLENVAHGVLHGVNKLASVGGCALLTGFHVYKAWDYGIYHQSSDSIIVRNSVIVDSTVGFLSVIYGPPATSHAYQNKFAQINDSLIVGRSDGICSFDMTGSGPNLAMRSRIGQAASGNPYGGRTAIMFPMFASGSNGAPKHFEKNKNYPAMYGKLLVTGVVFAHFASTCGTRDVIFFTMPANEDGTHPTFVSGVTKFLTERESYVYFARANRGKINPADCVDMPCDGKLKVLVSDLDGSLLGKPGAMVSQAEHGWGSQSLGLGDFRIPKAMLTSVDGKRLDINEIAPYKGIFRNDSCKYMPSWQGYDCHDDYSPEYRMLVIESLDGDTETRRLSPVAMLSGGYVDLTNGPQDHGWCAGYTCQKRLSTFQTLVALNRPYELWFSSTPPRRLRLHLLDAAETDSVVIGIWIPNPQLLTVHNGHGTYVPPNNAMMLNGKMILLRPPNPELYRPKVLEPGQTGENYLDRDSRLLYVRITGKDPRLTIDRKESIFVTFGVPAITITEFFEEDLVSNLALFLKVPKEKIRRVDVIREDSRKKRSADEVATVSLQISNNETDPTEHVDMTQAAYRLMDDYQEGSLALPLNITILSLTVSTPEKEEDIAAMDEKILNGEDVSTEIALLIPKKMRLESAISSEERANFGAVIHLLDGNDTLVTTSPSWTVTVSLDKTVAGADSQAELSGTHTATFVEGVATFEDLAVSHSGSYKFIFSSTMGDLPDVEAEFNIDMRVVGARVVSRKEQVLTVANANLEYTLQLTDKDGNNLEQPDFKGYVWKLEASFDDPTMYGSVSLTGDTVFDFESTTGQVVVDGLSLGGAVKYNKYNIKFRVYSEPAGYDFVARIEKVQTYPDDEADYIHLYDANMVFLRLTFDNQYDSVIGDNSKETIETGIYNKLREDYPHLFFTNIAALKADENFVLETGVMAETSSEVDEFVGGFTGITARGHDLTLVTECGISVDGRCYEEITTTTMQVQETATAGFNATSPVDATDDSSVGVIIYSILGVSVLLSAAIVGITCYVKRSSHLRKVSALRCMNNSQASTDSGRPLADSLDGFQEESTRVSSSSSGTITPVA